MKHKRYIFTAALAIIAFLFIIGLRSCGDSVDSAAARSLPDNFEVKQRVLLKWTDTYDVTGDDGANYGTVTKKLVSFTKSFVYDDNTGANVATASVAVLSWGMQIDVVDGRGKRIGTIKEEVLHSLTKTWTTYSILDANGNQVATSKKTEWWSTEFDLAANDGHAIATIHRNAFNWFGDKWLVTIKDHDTVDPRLEVMIAAFKSTADAEKKAADDEKKSSDSKKK